MRISDWSSDVCSSDLMARMLRRLPRAVNGAAGRPERSPNRCDRRGTASAVQPAAIFAALIWSAGARRRRQMFLFKKLALAALIGASALTALPAEADAPDRHHRHGYYGDRGAYSDYRPAYRRDYRSDERRVGEACGSACSSRLWAHN